MNCMLCGFDHSKPLDEAIEGWRLENGAEAEEVVSEDVPLAA